MKIGRNEYDINENDLILDNGACYQLVSREIGIGFNSCSPIISKVLFNKLLKNEAIYTNDDLKQQATKRYNQSGVNYWKFNIEKCNQRII